MVFQKQSDGHPTAVSDTMISTLAPARNLSVQPLEETYVISENEVINAVGYCLYEEEELEEYEEGTAPANTVVVKGITHILGFHPERLEEQRERVTEWLLQLPDQFKASGGGGWSFLNMCEDRDGNQWAGTHKAMEGLMCLGIGLGLVEYCVGREHWDGLYGGMPYIITFPSEEQTVN